MSSGLMSCVRENSPPLELERTEAVGGGPMSLPMAHDVSVEVIGDCKSTTMTSTSSSTATATTGNVDGSNIVGGVTNAEQQKRRRFHPLRNLRRIFRRRTITSVTDAPATTRTNTLPATTRGGGGTPTAVNSTSEKNLRSATLTSMSMNSTAASASSPSSPLTHQQLQDAYNTQSLPKSKSYATGTQLQRDVLLTGARGKLRQTLEHESNGESSTDYDEVNRSGNNMYTATTTSSITTAYHHHHHQSTTQHLHQQTSQRLSQSIGVAVLPPIGGGGGVGGTRGRSFFTERQKLRNIGDSTNDIDSTVEHNRRLEERNGLHNGSSNGGEITDSQRSLSEGRLVDSDFSREGLSQSHDSVFSESATASSLSIGLRAELADVLRKRRTRPDGSDEDLGLPRSPGSPQRRAEQLGHNAKPNNSAANNNNNTNQSGEISSVSLLSMTSNECDDFQATSTANNSLEQHTTERTTTTRYTRSATFSSMPTEILRHPTMSASFNESTKDEVDLFSSDWQRLSHSAARHKMAIRPAKKNVPTRQHRRTLESTIPETNEDSSKQQKQQAGNIRLNASEGDIKTKTRSLPPGVNAKLLEQQQQAAKQQQQHQPPTTIVQAINSATSLDTKTSVSSTATLCNNAEFKATSTPKTSKPTLLSETCSSSTKISSASHTMGTKIFGTRVFSNKATTLTTNEQDSKKDATTTNTTTSSTSTTSLETTENGFLRRLMQRNSKRNYAKANTADELDKNVVSEPKKIPVSTSCFEMTHATDQSSANEVFTALDKTKSALTYQQSIEETRKGIKREIKHEGKSGLSAILNNFTIAPERSNIAPIERSKPKSGPAARQRYVPQEINTPEKPPTTSITVTIPEQEMFQSTTIIRDITAKHSPTKDATSPHHHFEKKAKIVGLSAFQQKISRSNDSVVRLSNSSNSLETSTDDDLSLSQQQQKQRKSVEKSRSFRTYNEEQRDSGTTVRQNMPSLPDLTLNLCVPNYTQQFILQEKEYSSPSPPEPDKCASLGFEINDNTLLQPHVRGAESSGNINIGGSGNLHGNISAGGNYKRSFIVTTNTPARLLNSNAVAAPHISPGNSCQANISEIEQNIDMIVKSPFISVIRKSANLEEMEIKHEFKEEKRRELPLELKRPTTLSLKEKTKSEEHLRMTPSTPNTPKSPKTPNTPTTPTCTTAGVSLRINSKSVNEMSTSVALESPKALEGTRKSAPNSFKYMQRSPNSVENSPVSTTTPPEPPVTIATQPKRTVPEFMKIQLNHIDQARFMGKSNVVLAKNVKETTASKSESMDSIPRRLSDDSDVIITEQPTPVEQQQSIKLPATKTTSPTNNAPKSPTDEEPVVVLRPKADATPNKLSLLERKRLFMAEAIDKHKVDKKIEEIRNERKKSMSEEVFRKLSTCGRLDDQNERRDSTTTEIPQPTTPTLMPSVVNSPTIGSPTTPTTENVVILRKKSFGISSTNGNNHNNNHNNINSNNNNNNNNVRKDDSTPELMKVFARRSLKVKDEDLNTLADKLQIGGNHNQQTLGKNKTISIQQQNLDSDKENQSSSEEKLHKLSVDLEQMTSVTKITNSNLHVTTTMNSNSNSTTTIATTSSTTTSSTTTSNNRNSVADFRNNKNNNNTINNISNNKNHHLPPIKVSNGFRGSISNGSSTVERKLNGTNSQSVETIATTQQSHSGGGGNNNNNYNHQTNNNTAKRHYERQSLNISNIETPTGTTTNNTIMTTTTLSKSIERSATVGEFKGIHQRRAEWEQRAKEALK